MTFCFYLFDMGFPHSSVGKESACNARDPGSIPGSGRSAGEGIGYSLQYSWASLVAQLVKNLPEMWETWVWSLGWEDLLEKGMATHSSILAWRIPGLYSPWGPKSQTWLSDFHTHTHTNSRGWAIWIWDKSTCVWLRNSWRYKEIWWEISTTTIIV